MQCKNCHLLIEETEIAYSILWHHPTLERTANVDGIDIRIPVTFCLDDLGEATPE